MNKFTKRFVIVLAVLAAIMLQGCASTGLGGEAKAVTQAGINSFKVKPVEIAGQAALQYSFDLGKECQECTVDVRFSDTGTIKSISVDFKGVAAFQGQASAALAVVAVQKELKELGIEGAGVFEAIAPVIIKAIAPVPTLPEQNQ